MAVKQPANSNRFFQYFIKLCTFELIPTDGLMDDLFEFPDRGSYNIKFEETGYESVYAIPNLGIVYFIIHCYFLVSLVNLIVYPFTFTSSKLKTIHGKLNQKLYWNGYLVLIIEVFLELSMVALVNMKVADWSE